MIGWLSHTRVNPHWRTARIYLAPLWLMPNKQECSSYRHLNWGGNPQPQSITGCSHLRSSVNSVLAKTWTSCISTINGWWRVSQVWALTCKYWRRIQISMKISRIVIENHKSSCNSNNFQSKRSLKSRTLQLLLTIVQRSGLNRLSANQWWVMGT